MDEFTTIGAASRSPRRSGGGGVESFVEEYAPVFQAIAERIDVSPRVLAAQFGLETGWGSSVIPGTNNLGNIKDFSGGGVAATDNMTGSRDRYRRYATPDQFADDYANLITKRYPGAVGAGDDPVRFARALKAGGYAEDPSYVQKIAGSYSRIAPDTIPDGGNSQFTTLGRSGSGLSRAEPPAAVSREPAGGGAGRYVPYEDFVRQKQATPEGKALREVDVAREWMASYGHMESPEDKGDFGRGFKTAFQQIPQLGYGLAAIMSSAVESAAGPGGMATSAKNWAAGKYGEWGKKIAENSKESDEFDVSWERAKEGDFGALVDWMQYGVGYGAGQLVQAVGTLGAGALAGRVALKPAVERLAAGMVEKEVALLVKKGIAQDVVRKQAVANVAGRIGGLAAVGAQAFGMEGGEIGGDLTEKSVKEGRTLTGGELGRALGATVAAGSMEFAGDLLTLGAAGGRFTRGMRSIGGVGGRAARAAVGGTVTATGEGVTEYFQTLAEEYGKGNDPLSPESLRQAKNAAALGAIGGGAIGGAGGALQGSQALPVTPGPVVGKPAPTPAPRNDAEAVAPIMAASSVDEAAEAAMRGAMAPVGSMSNLDEPISRAVAEGMDTGFGKFRTELTSAIDRQKQADYDALQRESKLPAAMYDADLAARQESDAGTRANAGMGLTPAQLVAVEAAPTGEPTAMQLAFENARKNTGVSRSTIDEAAHAAATSSKNDLPQPTEAQKEAGNYAKGHISVSGMDISVENPAGTKRRPEWPTLKQHYGYVKGVAARAPDKEHVDVFVKPGTTTDHAGPVFVVDQNHADGRFDEPKAMIGFASQAEATAAYMENYTKGWERRVRGVTPMSMEQFKAKLNDQQGFARPHATGNTGANTGVSSPVTREMQVASEAPIGILFGKPANEIPLKRVRSAAKSKGPIGDRARAELARREAKRAIDAEARAATEKLKDTPSRDLLRIIQAMGGINSKHAVTVAGDKGVKGLGPWARLFKNQKRNIAGLISEGHGMDEIALELQRQGYMTQAEYESDGSNIAERMVKGAIAGQLEAITPAQVRKAFEANGKAKADEEADPKRQAEAANLKWDESTVDLLNNEYEGMSEAERADLDALIDDTLAEIGQFRMAEIQERLAIQTGSEREYAEALTKAILEEYGQSIRRRTGQETVAAPSASIDRSVGEETGGAAPQREPLNQDGNMEAYRAEARARNKKRDDVSANLQRIVDRDGGVRAELPDGRSLLLTKGTTGEPYRVTHFNKDGEPTGHIAYGEINGKNIINSAVGEFLAKGVSIVDPGENTLTLTAPTAQDLSAKAQQESAEALKAAAEAMKATADAMREQFTLTGSTRPADELAARGQEDLFGGQNANDQTAAYNAEAKRDDYTIDLFGNDGTDSQQGNAAPERNVDTASAIPRTNAPEPSTIVEPAQRGTLRTGYDKVDTPEKAAHTFAALRKASREYFQILLVDKNDKPLAVYTLGMGTLTQTSVFPREVLTAAYSTPGAAKLWMSHNHPSGAAEPSRADELLTANIKKLGLQRTMGVEYAGHVIIAGNRAASFADPDIPYASRSFNIPAAARKFEIPIMERVVKRQSFADRVPLTSPAETRNYITEVLKPQEDGLILMDAANRVMAWIPIDLGGTKTLLTGNRDTGAGGIFQAISRMNAGSAIGYTTKSLSGGAESIFAERSILNIGNALAAVDVRFLDVMWKDSGDTLRSAAEGGVTLKNGAALFSRRQQEQSRAPSVSARDAQAVVDRISPNYKNLPQITVLNRVSELPARVKELRDQIRRDGAANDVEAAYFDGEIFLFSDNVSDEARVEHVLFEHELTHYGLRGVLGPRVDATLNALYARNPELRKQAAAARARLGLDSNVAAVEEVLADMPTADLMKLKGFDRFLAVVRDWLAAHGFDKLAAMADQVLTGRVGEQAAADAMVGDVLRAAREFARSGKPGGTKLYMGGTRYADAYHGTPHDFEKFSLDKIGTGEGAQAYGWGLYFAENKGVAENYHRMLATEPGITELKLGSLTANERNNFDYSRRAGQSDRENIRASLAEELLADQHAFKGMTNAEFQREVIARLDARIKEYEEQDERAEYIKAAQTLRTMLTAPGAVSVAFGNKEGAVYQVDIPDEVVARMLDWDKPLSEQADSVKAAIRKAAKDLSMPVQYRGTGALEKMHWGSKTGEDFYRALGNRLSNPVDEFAAGGNPRGWNVINQTINDQVSDDRAASKYLNGIGVPGIKYFDGVSRAKGEGTRNFVVFDDKDVKLTHKNGAPVTRQERADFIDGAKGGDATAPAKYSRRIASAAMRVVNSAPAAVQDFLKTDRKLNRLMSKVNTPFHISEMHPISKPVYTAGQGFMRDTQAIALGAADLAKTLLPRVETHRDVLPKALGGKGLKAPSRNDVAQISRALYAGTFYGGGNPMQGVVWTDEELRGKETVGKPIPDNFRKNPLTPAQIKLYREALAAAGQSLEDHSMSLIWRLARRAGMNLSKDTDLRGMALEARDQIAEAIAEKRLQVESATDTEASTSSKDIEKVRNEIKELQKLRDSVNDIEKKTNSLIERGYFPSMRFGEHYVDVYTLKPDGKTVDKRLYFGKFESETERNAVVRDMRTQYPDAVVDHGLMNTSAHKLMQGMNLDTMEMFMDHLQEAMGDSADLDPLMQEFLRMAATERSTLAREIHRKGVPGQSQDIPRVLSQFLMTNARNAASTYHTADMMAGIRAITDPAQGGSRSAGDLARYWTDYVRQLQDPAEGAAALRGFIANYYLMGSIAFGMVNLTQPAMVTMPTLTRYVSPGKAIAYVAKASRDVVRGAAALPKGERDAYERAAAEGIVSPQEIHNLRAEAGASLTDGPMWRAVANAAKKVGIPLPDGLSARKVMFAWGSIFSLTEQFNRGTSFLSAYRLAIDEKMANPYEFAARMVEETQFTYNKANRPELMRGPVGAVIGQFKQFTISYVELAARLYRQDKQAFGVMMLMMFAMAGLEGLPFAEDIEDVIDSIGQKIGYATNTKKSLRTLATSIVGKDIADILLHGVSAIPGVPMDVAGRVGAQNIVPGTAMFKTSEPDQTREIMNALGPTAGIANRLLLRGDTAALMPKAIQDLAKGGDMALHDMYRDSRGKKVMDTDTGDAFWKAVGFMPASVARANRVEYQEKQDIDLQKVIESGIAEKWAQGVFERNPDKVLDARQKLADWNETNPELRVSINQTQIQRRVKEMAKTREERFVKQAAPEIRGNVRRDMMDAR